MSNQITIQGFLGGDPECKDTKDLTITSISVADAVSKLNEKTKKYELVHTNWFQVSSFSALANKVRTTLKKGDHILVKGSVKLSSYEKSDGMKISTFQVNANEILKLQSLN